MRMPFFCRADKASWYCNFLYWSSIVKLRVNLSINARAVILLAKNPWISDLWKLWVSGKDPDLFDLSLKSLVAKVVLEYPSFDTESCWQRLVSSQFRGVFNLFRQFSRQSSSRALSVYKWPTWLLNQLMSHATNWLRSARKMMTVSWKLALSLGGFRWVCQASQLFVFRNCEVKVWSLLGWL